MTDGAQPAAGYGLPRSARLLHGHEFRRVYRKGTRASGPHLTVIALRRRQPHCRLGLSVSKAHGSAVRRNKVKRLLREAFRLERPTLPGAFDVVLIPQLRPRYRLADLRQELTELIDRAASRSTRPPKARRP